MEQFTTTDMYLAAFMRVYSESHDVKRIGGKVVFTFTFNEDRDPNAVYREYLENAFLQTYITQVKEVRGEVYRLMKQQ
jgi:hypothetical protein